MEKDLKSALYNGMIKYIEALAAADAITEARLKETPTEKAERQRKELEAMQRSLFGDD